MSTSTSSCSSLTTVPSTRSPSSNSVNVPSIISFICSSEMSEKSITEVFLISVKNRYPFQKLNQGGRFVMMVDTYHVRLQKQDRGATNMSRGANRYLHLPPIGKPAQYSTARAHLLCEFSPSADIFSQGAHKAAEKSPQRAEGSLRKQQHVLPSARLAAHLIGKPAYTEEDIDGRAAKAPERGVVQGLSSLLFKVPQHLAPEPHPEHSPNTAQPSSALSPQRLAPHRARPQAPTRSGMKGSAPSTPASHRRSRHTSSYT